MARFDWNDEVIGRMVRIRKDGFTAAQIAEAIGAPSRNSVLGKLGRLGHCERKEDKGLAARALRRRNLKTVQPAKDKPRSAMGSAIAQQVAEARAKVRKDKDEATASLRQQQAEKMGSKEMADWANTPLPGTTPITIADLNSVTCRWPLDTPQGIRYCGCKTVKFGLSYCRHHEAASIGPGKRTLEQLQLVAEMRSGAVASEEMAA